MIPLGRRRIPLTVSEGHIKTAPVVADLKGGRVTGTTILDLDSQRVDSEWKVEGPPPPRRGSKPRNPLPPITVVWAGPLAQLASLEPQVNVDALERELSVRRMEVEVDELERLRRLDEDRARQEVERQRALEAERQKEAERLRAAQPPAPAPAPWPPAVPNPAPIAPGPGLQGAPAVPPQAPATKEAESAQPPPQEPPPPPAAAPKAPSPRPVARPAKRPFNPFSTEN